MIVLGIETSCDETAAALYDGSTVLANIVTTQEIHKEYGGVVPELASREHLRFIIPVIRKALDEADITWKDVEGIAVTRGPGLAGSLLMGISFAKAASFALDIPIIGVNHIEAHLWSPVFEYPELSTPFIGLIISGGHTQLWLVRDFGDYSLLGQTLDDAVGEAFDKIAQMLGLEYPGGPVIDKLSKEGDPDFYRFPRPALKSDNFDFSFSGLKTSVLYYLDDLSEEDIVRHKADIASSFQMAAVDTLVGKTIRAAKEYNIDRIVVGGGVAANSTLKKVLQSHSDNSSLSLFIPSPEYCTDNAAMIAYVGYHRFMRSESDELTFSALPSLSLESVSLS
ncbi:tRNA (adenosine(37)-N6)-threonylcarbamoyltransferase complex transferase subunit TsaD [candidate division KSB1 bacterium]|nr:tRNA (adenosine(37)-N6)-threonylcarbamoyltransferase complex transferase subunit TsaD [candidate division KSB1 bacterium]